MGVKTFREIPEGFCGNDRSGDCRGLRHCGVQECFQTLPGAAAQLNQQRAIMEEEAIIQHEFLALPR